MKKFVILIAVAVIIGAALLLNGCSTVGTTRYNTNIIKSTDNGVFNYETIEDMQKNWTLTTEGSPSSAFEIYDNGKSPNFIKIKTSNTGYATLSQRLYLRSYSYYKVSYEYKTSGMSPYSEDVNFVGLAVGFEEDPAFNLLDDKPTEEVLAKSEGKAHYYFKTEGIREVNIQIHVGTPDNPVSVSEVLIKDIKVERVTKATALEGESTSALYILRPAIYNRPSVLNNGYVIAGALVTILIAYAFYMLRARNIAIEAAPTQHAFYKKFKESKVLPVATVITSVLFVRLMITLIQAGLSGASNITKVYFGYDNEIIGNIGVWLGNFGPTYFFEYFESASILPLTSYLSMLAGLVGRMIGAIPSATEETVLLTTITMIKLFAVAADVGTALLIYKIIKAKHGNVAGAIMASCYALMPIVFVSSAYVGTFDSITVFLLTLTFYFILQRNYIGSASAYFFACMTTSSALIAVPFILMYTAFVIYTSIKDKTKAWIKPAVAIPLFFVLYFLITLPFFFTSVQKGHVFSSFSYFADVVKGLNVYSANAFNFQALLGNNFTTISTASTFVTILFILFIVGLLGFAYFRTKNRLTLMMLAASFIFVYWYFCNNMTPNSILIMLPLLFIYTALIGDRRLYALFSLIASFAFINTSYVYMVASYSETAGLQLDYSNPIMYIMGSFYMVLIIAYVIIGYDTVITKRAKPHLSLLVPYPEYAKSVAINAYINTKNFGYKAQTVFKEIIEYFKQLFSKNKDNGSDKDSEE